MSQVPFLCLTARSLNTSLDKHLKALITCYRLARSKALGPMASGVKLIAKINANSTKIVTVELICVPDSTQPLRQS